MVDQWRRREELLSEAVTKEAQLKKKARSKLIPFRKKSVQGIDLREVDDEIRDKTA